MNRAGVFAGGLNGLARIAGLQEPIAAALERTTGQPPQTLVVFDDEDGFPSARQRKVFSRQPFRARRAVPDAGEVDLEGRAQARFAVHPDVPVALLDDA